LKVPFVSALYVNGETNRAPEFSPFLKSIELDDRDSGIASTFTIELISYAATPVINIGDRLSFDLSYEDTSNILQSGTFVVDRIDFGFAPNIKKIGAIAFDFGLGLKGVSDIAYANATLRAIVSTQAAAAFPPLTVSPSLTGIDGFIAGSRSDENEGDYVVSSTSRLDLLSELAEQYGYIFSIASGLLRFEKYESAESQASIKTYTPTSVTPGARFDDNRATQIKEAWAEYVGAGYSIIQDQSSRTRDIADYRSEGFYVSKAAADRRCIGAIKAKNVNSLAGYFTIEGDSIARAGKVVTLSGWDTLLDGRWYVLRAVHRLSSSTGWIVDMDVRKIN